MSPANRQKQRLEKGTPTRGIQREKPPNQHGRHVAILEINSVVGGTHHYRLSLAATLTRLE